MLINDVPITSDGTTKSRRGFTYADKTKSIKVGAGDTLFASDLNGIWLGNALFASAPFRVSMTGALTATSATISGSITATSGTFGGWVLHASTLSSGAVEADSNVLIDSANSLIRLGPTSGVYITLDGANQRLRSSDYVAGASGFSISSALFETMNIVARGILKGATFAYDVISAVGGQLIISNADTLDADMTALDSSTLTTKGITTWAVNDIILIRAVATSGVQEEYMRITAIGSAPTYSVTRDLAASFAANSNPAWKKGTTVVRQGSSDGGATYSGGFLRLLGEGTNAPFYSVFARTGVAYNAVSERVRLGNLNGIGGKSADCFGIFIGDTSTDNYLIYDDVSGSLIVNGSSLSNQHIFGDGSDGNVTISADTSLSADAFYNNLTVDTGKVLNANGYRVFVKGTLTLSGTGKIKNSGSNGGNGGNAGNGANPGSAGTAGAVASSGSLPTSSASGAGAVGVNGGGANGNNGTNGTAVSKALGSAGVAGGSGGANTSGASYSGGGGGGGGAKSSSPFNTIRNLMAAYFLMDNQASPTTMNISGGTGGGGSGASGADGSGTGGASGGGGGGGGSAGIVAVFARKIAGAGTFEAIGGNGGNGGDGGPSGGGTSQAGSGGGGGGGGTGGVVMLIYGTKTGTTSAVVTGGTKGTGGAIGSGTNGACNPGVNGTDGNSGASFELVV